MEANKRKLERYIAEHCPNAEPGAYNNELRCYKKRKKLCKESGISYRCPDDCPHLNSEDVLCMEGKCRYVKEELKKII